ncbi:hypothetical protein BV898_13615 [Hypsibius exemplaris]|uniref:Uncharacterized protein n=1 Tax=Hypsibius exemplaris TaxID=2072580 RepID=A0A1W0WA89_HYPEX|nr:hypothetical protein BV898_13615 [Hypsibius exemplaris]
MGINHHSWIHGISVVSEDPAWEVLRRSVGTLVRPRGGAGSNWVHFAIATPTVANGNRVRAKSIYLRFKACDGARITTVHVYDGEGLIGNFSGLNLTGFRDLDHFTLPDKQAILFGGPEYILNNLLYGTRLLEAPSIPSNLFVP